MSFTSCHKLSSMMLVLSFLPLSAYAGGYKFSDGDKYLEVGARIQLQYKVDKPDAGPTTDDIFFRRLRVRVAGTVHKDWLGKVEWDMGKATGDNEVSIKETWMQYSGWENMKLRIGNSSFPFSREFMTPYTKQQLVERTFVGDLNYGTPDKNVGLHLLGNNNSKKITYRASAAFGSVQSDSSKLRFNTPVNETSGYVDGYMVGGRIDYHPLGFVKFQQGDFSGKTRYTLGVAAYAWSNDEITEDISNLPAGDYTVTVYDSSLSPNEPCFAVATFTVNEPDPIIIDVQLEKQVIGGNSVVVTALGREQELQDVPASVSVFDQQSGGVGSILIGCVVHGRLASPWHSRSV